MVPLLAAAATAAPLVAPLLLAAASGALSPMLSSSAGSTLGSSCPFSSTVQAALRRPRASSSPSVAFMTRSSETQRSTAGRRSARLPLSTSVCLRPIATGSYARGRGSSTEPPLKSGEIFGFSVALRGWPLTRASLGELDSVEDEPFGRRGDAQIFTQSAGEAALEGVR